MSESRRRVLVAVLVGALGASVGVAGAGHAYLREWRRAGAWFTFVLGVGLVLVSTLTDPQTVTPADLPARVAVPVLALLLLSVLDAYRVATRRPDRPPLAPDGETGATPPGEALDCPNCGRSIDPSIDFCWYCAEPVGDRRAGGGDDVEPDATSR